MQSLAAKNRQGAHEFNVAKPEILEKCCEVTRALLHFFLMALCDEGDGQWWKRTQSRICSAGTFIDKCVLA